MSFKASTNHQLSTSSFGEGEELVFQQLYEENGELRNELEMRMQENALLNEVISTVGSTLRLDEVLQHLVDIVVRATSCQVAFIYLYDKDKERLILASTTEKNRHLIGKISMALGEGIAGWVALHGKAAFVKEQAREDPRFCYFSELEEEKFQSIMTVPIITKSHNLVGVITVQSVAPREFTEQHRTFMNNAASLVGRAIENAQLYENSQRKLSTLTSLAVLSQTISSGLYLDEMLRSLANLTVQIMEVDLCVIMLMDHIHERDSEARHQAWRLTVRATSPNLNDRAQFQSVDIDPQTLERLRVRNEKPSSQESMSVQTDQESNDTALERLNPLKDTQYRSLISAPLIAGSEQLGLINCYSNRHRRFSAEDQTLLVTIANQAAIAIKNSYLVNQLAQKNLVKGFFDDLMRGSSDSEDSLRQRAHFLGCDLTKPHVPVRIEIAHMDTQWENPASAQQGSKQDRKRSSEFREGLTTPEANGYIQGASLQAAYKRMCNIVKRRIQDSYSSSVFYEHENLVTCIIPLAKDSSITRLKTWLEDFTHQMRNEYDVYLSIGVGNACQHTNDYRRGFAEANEALQMGQDLSEQKGTDSKRQPFVTHFNDLGVYRYLYKIAHMDDLRDVYQDQIAHIVNYDRRKNTDLLDTLETYLECAGNLTKTSDRLFVHRNTLIQRLERLQSLCDIDLQERSNWLTLQVAIKVYKLRNSGA
jgi:GAF domain-containing protein